MDCYPHVPKILGMDKPDNIIAKENINQFLFFFFLIIACLNISDRCLWSWLSNFNRYIVTSLNMMHDPIISHPSPV